MIAEKELLAGSMTLRNFFQEKEWPPNLSMYSMVHSIVCISIQCDISPEDFEQLTKFLADSYKKCIEEAKRSLHDKR